MNRHTLRIVGCSIPSSHRRPACPAAAAAAAAARLVARRHAAAGHGVAGCGACTDCKALLSRASLQACAAANAHHTVRIAQPGTASPTATAAPRSHRDRSPAPTHQMPHLQPHHRHQRLEAAPHAVHQLLQPLVLRRPGEVAVGVAIWRCKSRAQRRRRWSRGVQCLAARSGGGAPNISSCCLRSSMPKARLLGSSLGWGCCCNGLAVQE